MHLCDLCTLRTRDGTTARWCAVVWKICGMRRVYIVCMRFPKTHTQMEEEGEREREGEICRTTVPNDDVHAMPTRSIARCSVSASVSVYVRCVRGHDRAVKFKTKSRTLFAFFALLSLPHSLCASLCVSRHHFVGILIASLSRVHYDWVWHRGPRCVLAFHCSNICNFVWSGQRQ